MHVGPVAGLGGVLKSPVSSEELVSAPSPLLHEGRDVSAAMQFAMPNAA